MIMPIIFISIKDQTLPIFNCLKQELNFNTQKKINCIKKSSKLYMKMILNKSFLDNAIVYQRSYVND